MSMNFLNKAKETANKINEVAATTPVVAKPTLPGVKPNIPGKPPVGSPGKPPVGIPNKPPVASPGKPPVVAPSKPPIAKAPTAPVPVPTKETEIEIEVESNETVTAPLKNNNPFKKNQTTSTPPKTEEPKPEEKVEVKEEVKETNVGPTEEIVIEEKIVEPVAKKTTTRKKPAAKADAIVSDGPEVITETALIIPKTQVEFDEAINSIKSGFVDESWETFREDNVKRLNEIVISSDMTTAMIKSTLSELSLMKDSIWLIFNDTKTMYENLTAKEPEGLIERIKKISSKGSNPEERKLNATYAVMNYKDENGNNVNLYELLDEIRDRYNFTKSLMDGINYKNSVLITMLGSLKLEK